MFKLDSLIKYLLFVLVMLGQGRSFVMAQSRSVDGNNPYRIPELAVNNFNLFENDDILELTLMFDITTYMEEKPDEEYLDALLSYKYNGIDSVNKIIKLRARGNFRYRTCDFPPLRLRFTDVSFGFADLDSLDNIKMVTHCSDSIIYQDYLMREYLVYKLYNIVTDYSFRVRLLKVRYLDTGSRGLHSEQYAFVIEPLDIALQRLNAVEVEEEAMVFDDVEPRLMDKIAFFQMLIANTDWSIPLAHNFKIIKGGDTYSEYLVPLPYDFDYSGFVNSHYATPANASEGGSITDRVYQGCCRSEEELRAALEEFRTYRDAFIEEIRNFKYLDRSIRKELTDYINSFYNQYRNDALLTKIMEECTEKK